MDLRVTPRSQRCSAPGPWYASSWRLHGAIDVLEHATCPNGLNNTRIGKTCGSLAVFGERKMLVFAGERGLYVAQYSSASGIDFRHTPQIEDDRTHASGVELMAHLVMARWIRCKSVVVDEEGRHTICPAVFGLGTERFLQAGQSGSTTFCRLSVKSCAGASTAFRSGRAVARSDARHVDVPRC
jgi:hypothetical protein